MKKSSSGVITVFLSLLLIPMLAFGTLIMEIGRYADAKSVLTEAQLTSSMSMLANYNTYLLERFGLLAMDTGVPARTQTSEFSNLLKYNLDSDVHDKTNSVLCNVETVDFASVYTLSDFNVLKRQILEYSKYSVPYTVLSNKLDLEGLINSALDSIKSKFDVVKNFLNVLTEKSENTVDVMEDAFNSLGEVEYYALTLRNFFGESNTTANYTTKDLYDEYISDDRAILYGRLNDYTKNQEYNYGYAMDVCCVKPIRRYNFLSSE